MSKEQCKLPAAILHQLTAISGVALSATPPQKTNYNDLSHSPPSAAWRRCEKTFGGARLRSPD